MLKRNRLYKKKSWNLLNMKQDLYFYQKTYKKTACGFSENHQKSEFTRRSFQYFIFRMKGFFGHCHDKLVFINKLILYFSVMLNWKWKLVKLIEAGQFMRTVQTFVTPMSMSRVVNIFIWSSWRCSWGATTTWDTEQFKKRTILNRKFWLKIIGNYNRSLWSWLNNWWPRTFTHSHINIC